MKDQEERKITVDERRQLLEDIVNGNRTQSDVAREFGLSRQAVSLWVKKFKKDGSVIGGIATRGRPNLRLPQEARKKVVDIIQTTWPMDHDVDTEDGLWDAKAISQLLKQHTGERFNYDFCFRLFLESTADDVHREPPQPPQKPPEKQQKKAPVKRPVSDADIQKLTSKELKYYEKKVQEGRDLLKERGLDYEQLTLEEMKGLKKKKKKGAPVTRSKKKNKKTKKNKKGKKRK